MPFLSIIEDETTHTLALTGTGGIRYEISHPGCESIVGRIARGEALKLIDAWDADCNEGTARLVAADDETLVNFRHGLI